MKILAIVVTYNRKELLKECINALLNQKQIKPDILVIDNASTDNTELMVKEFKHKSIKYLNTGANLGGAGGFNYGLKAATKYNYDYYWVMDDDTIPNETALKELISAADYLDDDFGFLASKVLWLDESFCKMNISTISKKWYENEDFLKKELISVSSSSFVSCFIKKEVVIELGLPFKEFFIWGDDAEYTRRISKKHRCFFVNKSVVIHKMQKNESVNIVAEENKSRISRTFYNYRNWLYIYKQEGRNEVVKFTLKTIKDFFLFLFKSKKYRFRKSYLVMKGYFCGIFFNPKVEYCNKK